MTIDPEGRNLLCILGPTASGKTRLAVAAAGKFGGEIISADSRQVYRGMDIGTGKDLEEYRVGDVPVAAHLIDIVEPGTEFNVFEFQKRFLQAYEEIRSRGRLPILCGGSGLYLESVLRGYRLIQTPTNEGLRREAESTSTEELIARLEKARPLHNTTDTTSRERLIRAIEIAEYEEEHAGVAPEFPRIRSKVYGIHWERDELRRRITERLKKRLEAGMVEEVQALLDAGLTADQLKFYGLEYKFVTSYVQGECTRNDMYQRLNSAIHRFAKKQMNFFRKMERDGIEIIWLKGEEASFY